MSFVDLMADHRWTEADIVARTEAMVREHFSAAAEQILSRKVMGAGMGFPLATAEMMELQLFQNTVLSAKAAGEAARADMLLLLEALAVERGEADLGVGPEVQALVGQRADYRAAMAPPEETLPEPEEVEP